METSSVRTNSRHQITIPEWARKQLNIKSGDHLLVNIQEGMMILVPLQGRCAKTLAGLHREIWGESDSYLAQERNVWTNSIK